MSEKKSATKSGKSSSKHQPYGLTILFEDRDIIVVDKINGLLTIGTGKGRDNERTAHYLLNNYVQKGNIRSKNRVYIVHRLDKDTSGILVFAKNIKAKDYLQKEWSSFKKKYYAVVNGRMPEKQGTITTFLSENKAHRVYVAGEDENGKLAKTGYKTLLTNKRYSLLEIELFTGRKHQIRVHLAHIKYPVLGDKIYNSGGTSSKRLALHSFSLTIKHPYTKEPMTFETDVPEYFKALVKSPKPKNNSKSGEESK